MVRHPKKKDEDKKPAPEDSPAKDMPPEEPKVLENDEVRIRRGLDRVFWLRVGMGILAGATAAMLGISMDTTQRMVLGFGIMIALFIVSYGIAKSFRVPLLPTDKKKLATTGYGSYFLMFIFSWILINTVINSAVSTVTVH